MACIVAAVADGITVAANGTETAQVADEVEVVET